MSSVNITYLVEQAFVALLQSKTFNSIPAASIYPGMYRELTTEGELVEMSLPRAVCICQNAEAVTPHAGGWSCTVEIVVQTSYDDNDAASHHRNCSEVFGEIVTDSIASDLMLAREDILVECVNNKSIGWDIEDRVWSSTLTLEVHCDGKAA